MFRVALGLVVAVVAANTALAGLEQGLDAHRRGDHAEAFAQFQAAADSGVAQAQYRLALMYFNGESVPESYRDALRWFERAAEAGHADAQYRVAAMYDASEGVRSSNPLTAYKWYKRAAEQGQVEAQFVMGNLYADGVRVPQNYEKAFAWYKKAAQSGHVLAQYEVARYFDVGLESVLCTQSVSPAKCRERTRNAHLQKVQQDDAVAFDWFLKAARGGHAAAQLRVGQMYEDGEGTKRDYQRAVEWYTRAAEQGLIEARYRLAQHDQSPAPTGVLQVPDLPTRSAELRRAEEGAADAQLKVATMFDKGLGVPKDYIKAYMWYNLAAAQGDPAAREGRDQLEGRMTPPQIAEAQRLSREMSQRIRSTLVQ